MLDLSAKYIAGAEECSFTLFLLNVPLAACSNVLLINGVKMHQPQQEISASPHSLNGEKIKYLFGGIFSPLYFFRRRYLTKLFKREFLQLMHLLKTPV